MIPIKPFDDSGTEKVMRSWAILTIMVCLGTAASSFSQQPAVPRPVLSLDTTSQPANSDAKQAENSEKAQAAAMEELAKNVGAIAKRLTVLTVTDDVKVILGGVIEADFLYNHARPISPGTPFFLTPRSPFGFAQDTFDAHGRQTTLFAAVQGPKMGDWDTGGLVMAALYNDSIIVDRYGLLPLQAYGEIKNTDWRFAAGLQFDVFNPLNPSVLPISILGGSGNTGAYRGQARLEHFLHPSCDSQVTLTVGISDPVPTIVSNTFILNEDNGWPNVEGRAALALGPIQGEGLGAKRPFEVGCSGVVGQLRNFAVAPPARVVADVWGVGSDLRWAFTDRCGVQGEVFIGHSLGTYMGSILQNVNTDTFRGIHSAGGWIEAYYYLCPQKLHTHVGYGIDDPLDGDLAPGQPVRNETYFANLIWDVTKNVRFDVEATYRRTAYTIVRNNDGVGFQTQMQWKF